MFLSSSETLLVNKNHTNRLSAFKYTHNTKSNSTLHGQAGKINMDEEYIKAF